MKDFGETALVPLILAIVLAGVMSGAIDVMVTAPGWDRLWGVGLAVVDLGAVLVVVRVIVGLRRS